MIIADIPRIFYTNFMFISIKDNYFSNYYFNITSNIITKHDKKLLKKYYQLWNVKKDMSFTTFIIIVQNTAIELKKDVVATAGIVINTLYNNKNNDNV